MQNILTNRDSVNYDPLTEAQLSCLHHNIKQYLEGASSNIEVNTGIVHVVCCVCGDTRYPRAVK